MGNLAMGGRGKTPVVSELARRLVALGERPAVLSRGYMRERPEEGVVVVSDGRRILSDLGRAGDEPLMIARAVPGAMVFVSDVRSVAAALAERQYGATVHVLDDGFQHRSVRRDADLVLVSAGDLEDRRVPFGRLRSPVSALARAEAIVVDGASAIEAADLLRPIAAARGIPVFGLRRALGAPAPLEPDRPWPRGRWPVVAVAGIARPERFRQALVASGWHVTRTLRFADHHRYTPRDVARIAEALREHGAGAVLTTMKDAMRLLPYRPLPVPVAAMPLEVTIDPTVEFDAWIDAQVKRARR